MKLPHEGDNKKDEIIKTLREEVESYREQCHKLECEAAEANEARKQVITALKRSKYYWIYFFRPKKLQTNKKVIVCKENKNKN